MDPTYIALLANFGLLAICGLLVTSVSQIWDYRRINGFTSQMISGLVFGGAAAIQIMLSTAIVSGAVFDSRAAPAILAGIVGGPWAALITAAMGGAARLYVGGDWVVNGVLSVVFYCASGAIAVSLFQRLFKREISLVHMAPLAAIATCAALPIFFIAQPFNAAVSLIENIFVTLFITNVVSVTALSLIILVSTRTAADREQLLVMRAAVTRAANGVIITDASDKRHIIFANDAVTKIFGYSNSELTGRSTDLFFGPDAGSEQLRSFRMAVKTGREVTETFINYRKDGTPFHNQVTLTPIFSSTGDLTHCLSVFADVTKEMESRSALKTLAAQIPITLIYTNLSGHVEYINNAAAELFSAGSDPHRASDLQSVIGPDLAAEFAPWIEAAIAGGEIKREQKITTLSGKEIEARMSFAPTVSDDGDQVGVIISIEDITAYKQMEAALAQSQRLQSIGTLTGGIAHDFNNLNTVVIGNLDLLKLGGPTAEAAEYIDEALAAARRGAKLTQSLLSFGRQAMLKPDRIDLSDGLTDLENLLRSSIKESTKIEFARCADKLEVEVDQTNLESAILNLVVNADHAIGDKAGNIRIEFRERRFDCGLTDGAFAGDFGIEAAGRFAAITISDDGPGVPEGDRSKIIEPFFTTKGRHSGTGLGLAMVHGFVRQSGGFMRITENQPTGIVVSLYLPISDAAAAENSVEPPLLKAS